MNTPRQPRIVNREPSHRLGEYGGRCGSGRHSAREERTMADSDAFQHPETRPLALGASTALSPVRRRCLQMAPLSARVMRLVLDLLQSTHLRCEAGAEAEARAGSSNDTTRPVP